MLNASLSLGLSLTSFLPSISQVLLIGINEVVGAWEAVLEGGMDFSKIPISRVDKIQEQDFAQATANKEATHSKV